MHDEHRLTPWLAGMVTAVVGFAGAFTVVLAGLRGVGATESQASSGLLVLCLACAVLAIGIGLRTRMPIWIAWSTPGAALLISVGAVDGGFSAAVGAFVVSGLLIVLAGLWDRLGRWIAAIPIPIASAMLAGVLLPLCLAPAKAVVDIPGRAIPVVAVWLVLMRFARRWAVPGALAATAVVVGTTESLDGGSGLLPTLAWVTPSFDLGAVVSIGVPLFLVTMASQNIPGMGVLASYGYRPKLKPLLVSTGAASAAGAPFGAHAVNLAAITAALAAGPDAHPDPERRWVASVAAGLFTALLGLFSGVATELIASSPPLLIQTLAGLALLGPLGSSLATAVGAEGDVRDAAVVTFVVSASGITAFSITGAFWGLVAGLLFLGVQRLRPRPAPAGPPPPA